MAEQPHRCNKQEVGQTPADGEGQGGLEGCSPWSRKELDTTERLNDSNNKSPIKRMNTGFGVQSPSSSSRNQVTRAKAVPLRTSTSLSVKHRPYFLFKVQGRTNETICVSRERWQTLKSNDLGLNPSSYLKAV